MLMRGRSTSATCIEALDRLRSRLAFHRGTVIGHLMLVLSHLARAVAATRRDLADSTGPTHPGVVQTMRLSEGQAHPPLDLTELAKELLLAPGYLVQLFKSATDLPPMAYLARHRVEAAALLLHTTSQ
jgi:AraC family L-rhamnose operon transcriptional activator RhaR